MSNSVFIKQDINNNQLNAIKAMPLKDSTSDNTSDFELGRKIYSRTYNPTLTDGSLNSLLRQPNFGQNGRSRILPTVFDGTHAPIQKKWMGSTNRDSSQITTNRRTNSVGKGSLNLSRPVQVQNEPQELPATLLGGGPGIYWSNDGIIWNQSESIPTFDVFWSGTEWVALTISGVTYTSSDGKNWVPNYNSSGFFDLGIAIGQNDNNIVIMGESFRGAGSSPIDNTLINSTDYGNTWQAIQDSSAVFTNSLSFAPQLKVKGNVSWNGNVWIGVGSGPNSIGYSGDVSGSTWQGAYCSNTEHRDTSSNLFQIGTGLAINSETLNVAVGFSLSGELYYYYNDGSEVLPSKLIAWSGDGIVWTPATLHYNDDTVINTNDIPHFMSIDIEFNGNSWITICADVVIFGDVNGYVFLSSDGENWKLYPLKQNFFPISIIWYNNLWIITGIDGSIEGSPLILYSSDGITWDTDPNETPNVFFKMATNGEPPTTINNNTTISNTSALSFTNGNDRNLINHALRRVRGGGSVAPPKKNFSSSHTYVPSPGTHPYMQPGFKGKIGGYFPTSRYNKQNYQNNQSFTVGP
jgi:hypothetical protein